MFLQLRAGGYLAGGGGSGGPSCAVTISDSTPSYGDSVTVTITPTGITAPTGYVFYLPCKSGEYTRVSQAGNTYVWTVDGIGDCTVYGGVTDGTDTAYDIDGIDITVSYRLLDGLVRWPEFAVSPVLLSTLFTGDIIEVRRSGDNSIDTYTYTELTDGTVEAWVTAGGGTEDGFIVTLFSQVENGRDLYHATAGNQWKIVDSGSLCVDTQGLPVGKTVDPANQLNFRGFGTSDSGTVYVVYKPSGGNLSGKFGSVLGRNANPAIGRFDDTGADTNVTAIGAGTPTNKVNGVTVSPNQRGALGTAVVGNEVIHTIDQVDWTANIATWAGTLLEPLEYCDNDTEFSAMLVFNAKGTDEQAYIESKLNEDFNRY